MFILSWFGLQVNVFITAGIFPRLTLKLLKGSGKFVGRQLLPLPAWQLRTYSHLLPTLLFSPRQLCLWHSSIHDWSCDAFATINYLHIFQ